MFKKYIRKIVKEEINDIKLEITLKQLGSKTYWENHFKSQVKHTELLVKGRDKEISRLKEIIENLEGKLILNGNLLSEQKQENEELKKSLKNQKDYRVLDLKASLQTGYKLESLKQENEKLKKENEQLKNLSCTIVVGNDGKLDSLFNQKLKSENEKLQSKVDEYYNKFLSEGIKKEKAQRKLREIKKEIDSQGFDHEGFYNLHNMYQRIENILKES